MNFNQYKSTQIELKQNLEQIDFEIHNLFNLKRTLSSKYTSRKNITKFTHFIGKTFVQNNKFVKICDIFSNYDCVMFATNVFDKNKLRFLKKNYTMYYFINNFVEISNDEFEKHLNEICDKYEIMDIKRNKNF